MPAVDRSGLRMSGSKPTKSNERCAGDDAAKSHQILLKRTMAMLKHLIVSCRSNLKLS
jgi:hypothetical protein